MDIAALVVAIVSAAFAGGSFWYARRAVRSADSSASSAAITAGLDIDRRHSELSPRFRVTLASAAQGSDDVKLQVGLTGPPELECLDGLTVTIRDDHPWRGQGEQLAGGPTPEQVAAQIWGYWRFIPGTGPGASMTRGVPGADQTGRTTPTSGLPVGESLPFFLEPTRPPRWSTWSLEDWQRQVGRVLRLRFECSRDGYEPWVITCELSFDGLGTAHIDVPPAIGSR